MRIRHIRQSLPRMKLNCPNLLTFASDDVKPREGWNNRVVGTLAFIFTIRLPVESLHNPQCRGSHLGALTLDRRNPVLLSIS
jgi:hypothetical protein